MKTTEQLKNGYYYDLYTNENKTKKYAIYLHGGGLIYGSKNDIPTTLITTLHNANYNIIALDYPLSPNTSLLEILTTLAASFTELLQKYNISDYILLGRSAGSFLMFQLTRYILENNLVKPQKLINFYGYTDLNFVPKLPNSPIIDKNQISSIDITTKNIEDSLFQRYPLYIYAIQQNVLHDFYGVNEQNKIDFALTNQQLEQFPPTFSTASTSDTQVPYKYSKLVNKIIPNSTLVTLYYTDHDFLTLDNNDVATMYTKLSQFLN